MYRFLLTIALAHHVFHSEPSRFLLYLVFDFILDFICHETIAQPLNCLGCDFQPLVSFDVCFILDLICSENR